MGCCPEAVLDMKRSSTRPIFNFWRIFHQHDCVVECCESISPLKVLDFSQIFPATTSSSPAKIPTDEVSHPEDDDNNSDSLQEFHPSQIGPPYSNNYLLTVQYSTLALYSIYEWRTLTLLYDKLDYKSMIDM